MTSIFGPALELVREFHRDKDLPIFDDLEQSQSRPQLRAFGTRVLEEARELRTALRGGDFAEVIKELADVVYSSLGVVVAFDLPVDEAFLERLGDVTVQPVADGPLATAMSLAPLGKPATRDPVALAGRCRGQPRAGAGVVRRVAPDDCHRPATRRGVS